MPWRVLLQFLSAQLFNVLSWPSFTLLCPLYASYWAIESDSQAKSQKCLTFWVLFALLAILENALAKLLLWLPYWPYVKGTVTVLLVVPYFGGASYVYKCFVRTHPFKVSEIFCLIWNILFIPVRKNFPFNGLNNFVDEIDKNRTVKGQEEQQKPVIFQGTFKPNYDNVDSDQTPIISKKVQREWSCSLCLVSTTNEKCLNKHLRGKKHKAKKEEVRAEEMASNLTYSPFYMAYRNQRMVLVENLVNLGKLSRLVNPVKSIRWCKWENPKVGCIKLNTDGSLDRENARFGGLLRDYRGDAICGFVSKAPLDDVFLVELSAVWRGLVLASGLGIKAVWVESDSLSVVKTINGEQSHRRKAEKCLKQIWLLLKKFDSYQVSHSWRETNKAADYLSKMALQKSDVVLWPCDFPSGLQNIIKDDAEGRIYCRR
ncbi:uncharacterized protein LOC110616199 [Manihot esculenta]|uniref:Uncharacterized protein n=1 Tax=Manihot esculenta TaxID=3983 RepID=A0A2C9VXS4_MANES|nr:uncharacterized protein LOC110616199 [Manihot esculenta]OAY51114.1 hypothetical protein MANES_05G189300v8 [Manihot esculenta]